MFTVLASTSVVLSAVYSLWTFNRIAFGTLRVNVVELIDLSRREFYLFIPFIAITILFGLVPNIILDSIHFSTKTMMFSIAQKF
jgi:NADH:ubiquinone oxidoreductase subunit 4 (subunit M)